MKIGEHSRIDGAIIATESLLSLSGKAQLRGTLDTGGLVLGTNARVSLAAAASTVNPRAMCY